MRRASLPFALVVLSLLVDCRFGVSGLPLSDDAGVSPAADLAEPGDAALMSSGGDLATVGDLASGPDMMMCLASCSGCVSNCCSESWTTAGTDQSLSCDSTCNCSATGSGVHDSTITCATASTCSFNITNAHDTTVSCSAGATCSLTCTGSHACTLQCAATASCLVDCTTMPAGACSLSGCPVTPTTCPNNVQVCGRACP